MDYTTPFIILSALWLLILTVSTLNRRKINKRLPPGPPPYPIIGNIPHVGTKPHLSLTSLSKTYGPIMSLHLGQTLTVVVSSRETAQMVLQKHDQTLYMRPTQDALRPLGHSDVSMLWTKSPAHFRNLRKLCMSQLFTSQRLDASQELRKLKVQQLIKFIDQKCDEGDAVEIRPAVFTTSLNLLSTTFFSSDLASYNSEEANEFSDFVEGIKEVVPKSNISDLYPALRVFDMQGVFKKARVCFEGLFRHFDRLIDNRLETNDGIKMHHDDVLNTMLQVIDQQGSDLNRNDMMHLLLDLFIAGTETTSSAMESVMTELLHNPSLMKKAKEEIAQVLGTKNSAEESDIVNMPYIQALVKETLRLHSPAHFLLPRIAMTDTDIDGYTIPKDTKVLVNIRAIHRDEKLWTHPEVFMPERFLDENKLVAVKGQGFELLPFGGGRRICPGMSLAYRMLHLTLASLLHAFDWKLENEVQPNVKDKIQEDVPLRAVPYIKK